MQLLPEEALMIIKGTHHLRLEKYILLLLLRVELNVSILYNVLARAPPPAYWWTPRRGPVAG